MVPIQTGRIQYFGKYNFMKIHSREIARLTGKNKKKKEEREERKVEGERHKREAY